MFYDILAFASSQIISIISAAGYLGIFFLMTLESALIPVPSEIIMPFSGFLIWEEKFSFWPVVLAGTLGNLLGSIIAYFIGFYGGRPLILKYGKYVLISAGDLERAEIWFKKYGNFSIMASRMLPAVRTFISLPAGIARMSFGKFCLYTFLGSLPWSILLTYVGVIGGENWQAIDEYIRKFDWLVIIIAATAVGYWLFIKLKRKKQTI